MAALVSRLWLSHQATDLVLIHGPLVTCWQHRTRPRKRNPRFAWGRRFHWPWQTGIAATSWPVKLASIRLNPAGSVALHDPMQDGGIGLFVVVIDRCP